MADNLETKLEQLVDIVSSIATNMNTLTSRLDSVVGRIDSLTVLVEKHEKSRMAFRQYMRQMYDKIDNNDIKHAQLMAVHYETMAYLKGQSIENRRIIDQIVGKDETLSDED